MSIDFLKKKWGRVGGAGLATLLLLLLGKLPADEMERTRLTRTQILMGTVPVTITLLAPDSSQEDAWEAMSEAFRMGRQIEQEVRSFETVSSRDPLTPYLAHLLERARELSRQTEGSFDIFHSGPPDLGGIAKGSIVDTMALHLKEQGYDHFTINAGGDLWVEGRDRQGPWQITIQNPTQQITGSVALTLPLQNQAIATSGFYERGKHIIDPKTQQVAHSPYVSVTVIADSAEKADALATAGFVLGKKAPLFFEKLQRKDPSLGAILIALDKIPLALLPANP